jgi:hypothetical protein
MDFGLTSPIHFGSVEEIYLAIQCGPVDIQNVMVYRSIWAAYIYIAPLHDTYPDGRDFDPSLSKLYVIIRHLLDLQQDEYAKYYTKFRIIAYRNPRKLGRLRINIEFLIYYPHPEFNLSLRINKWQKKPNSFLFMRSMNLCVQILG